MSDDLTDRLREDSRILRVPPGGFPTIAAELDEAAARIAALETELANQIELRNDQCRRKLAAIARAEKAEAEVATAYDRGVADERKAARLVRKALGEEPADTSAYARGLEDAAKVAENVPDQLVGTMELPPSQFDIAAALRALAGDPKE